MCDCSRLPDPFHAGHRPGDVERCPSCDTPYKLTARKLGTFTSMTWEHIRWWDLPARIRAALIPEQWS